MRIKPMKRFSCMLTPPSDKSVTIRALIMGYLAFGRTVITNPLISGDTVSAMNAVASLGGEVDFKEGRISVLGGNFSDGKVDAGNSATTARLLCGAVAAKSNVIISGDRSLSRRNMRPLIEALSAMGAKISSQNGLMPIEVKKSDLSGINFDMTFPSAQIKSAVLLAGLSAEGETRVKEHIKTRTHTEDMLKAFGADIDVGEWIRIRRSRLSGAEIDVAGDMSAAVYPMVLALKRGFCYLKNVGTARHEPVEFLRSIGGRIEEESFGDRANLTVWQSDLKPFAIDGQLAASLIDELPLFAVLAATLDGESRISGAKALRNKECDRIKCTVENLRLLGAQIEERADGFIIAGGGIRGGNAHSYGDHRMAMSMAVANALSEKGGSVDDEKCVGISYPSFWELFI